MIRDQKPWSAAFISWVLREAGAGDAFSYSALHTTYIAAAKRAAVATDGSKFQAYDIASVRPDAGDLVCRDRAPRTGAACAGTNFSNVDRGGISHSDIVVEVQPNHIVIMGGNTAQTYPARGKGANTAGQRRIQLDDRGFVVPQQGKSCRYFAIVKAPGSAAPQPAVTLPSAAPTIARPPAELVRFAQRVLNAVEGERLSTDGDLGPKTRAALVRFRTKYNLGAEGVIDGKTVIALAQKALEEIRQQSLFGQIGVLDSATQREVAAFKSERRLNPDASLDATTRAALIDALAQRSAMPKPRPPSRPGAGAGKGGAIKTGGWGGWKGRANAGVTKITPNQIRDKYALAVAVAAEIETGGAFDKVQMYDRGILSWGIKQWTLHAGSLQGLLAFIKTRIDSGLWSKLFPGLDMSGETLVFNGTPYATPKGDSDAANLALRRILRGTESQTDFDATIMDRWIGIFGTAGLDPTIQKLQLEYAITALKRNLNLQLGRVLAQRNLIKGSQAGNYGRVGDYIESSPLALALFNTMETQNPKYTYEYLKRVINRFAQRNGTYNTTRWPADWREKFADELRNDFAESGVGCWGRQALKKAICKNRESRTSKALKAYAKWAPQVAP